jgi:excinuclease UvrABC nuclease subunit
MIQRQNELRELKAQVAKTIPSASVYRFYDKRGKLLYVGVTSRGMKRFFEHGDTASLADPRESVEVPSQKQIRREAERR